MRNILTKFALTATLGLAITFTLSCSSDESGTDSPSSGSVGDKYSYCVFVQSKICLEGYFDHCAEGGSLSNTCPFNSSVSSSSTTPGSSSSNGSSPSSSSSLAPSVTPSSSSSLVVTGNTFTDSRDMKEYRKVTIGTQTWMAENLNYNASGSKCYSNSDANCTTYGRLYTWETAKTVCPSGWHLPTKAEWTTLTDYVGSSTAGTKLKSASGWNSNGNGTDDYGFAALPGGNMGSNGSFYVVGSNGTWWSASGDASNPYYIDMSHDSEVASWADFYNNSLFSVRCLQGSDPAPTPSSSSIAPSSSSSNQSELYCDYGPVTQYGGGCFEIDNASECDTEWGEVVSSCSGGATQPGGGGGKHYCNVTEDYGSCFYILNASECTGKGAKLVSSCLFCDATGIHGACNEIDNESQCLTETGAKVVSSCSRYR